MKKLLFSVIIVIFITFVSVNSAKSQHSTVSVFKEILINYTTNGPANFVNAQEHNVSFEEIDRQDFIDNAGRHLKVIHSVTIKNDAGVLGKYLLIWKFDEAKDASGKDMGVSSNIDITPLQ